MKNFKIKEKTFNPYNKPVPPIKPNSKICSHKNIFSQYVDDGEYFVFPDEVKNKQDIILINIEGCGQDDGCDYSVNFFTETEVDNPDYEKEMKKYEEKYLLYKEELKTWKADKIEYDLAIKDSELKQKKELFEKLKKELELNGIN